MTVGTCLVRMTQSKRKHDTDSATFKKNLAFYQGSDSLTLASSPYDNHLDSPRGSRLLDLLSDH